MAHHNPNHANQVPLQPFKHFQMTVCKSMLRPKLQVTLPSKVAKSLNLNPSFPAEFWFTLAPGQEYWVPFLRQAHPGGGWRNNPFADWEDLVMEHNIFEGEVLTFTKMNFPGNYYTLRSPRLDAWNRSRGANPETMFAPPPPPGFNRVIVVDSSEEEEA